MRFSAGLEKIGIGAFNTNGLKSVELPASLRTVSQAAFAKCKSLKTVKFNAGLEVLGTDEYVENGELYYGVFAESSVEGVELPATLTRIEYCAFENCKNLKSINLPNSLERVGKRCFQGSGLEEIMIPKTVKSIGDNAFNGSALKKIVVEEGCQTDVKSAVGGNVTVQTVRNVKIPAGTKVITENWFNG